MLKNDEIFWRPDEGNNAASLSWGGSAGEFETLWEHSQKKWRDIARTLRTGHVPLVRGKILEFGPGMGLLDDLLDESASELLLLDHTAAYIQQRRTPLSSRCRHVLLTPENLKKLLREETESYDWLLSISVFYHLDEATAVAIILELGKLLKPGGHALIYGWNDSTPEMLRERGTFDRLFAEYPQYFINWDFVTSAISPDFREVLRRRGKIVYQKTQGGMGSTSKNRTSFRRNLEDAFARLRMRFFIERTRGNWHPWGILWEDTP